MGTTRLKLDRDDREPLGLKGIACLDIRQQCTGFIYGLAVADNFVLVEIIGFHALDPDPSGTNVRHRIPFPF